MSSKITYQQIMALEDIASKVYDDQMTLQEGLQYLVTHHNLNESSAQMYILNYRAMLEGKVFKRSMSAEAADYFLTKIFEQRGKASHTNALLALEQHVEYLENHVGTEMHKMRAVIAEHLNKYY